MAPARRILFPYLLTRLIPALMAVAAISVPAWSEPGTALLQSLGIHHYLLAADRKCHGLGQGARDAMTAAFIQTRNESLRSGFDNVAIAGVQARADDYLAARACTDPALQKRFADANAAFSGFIAANGVGLPSHRSRYDTWRAFGDDPAWRLVQFQTDGDQAFGFGLYGPLSGPCLSVMAQFSRSEAPYAARLLVRNTDMAPIGVINPAPYGLSRTRPFGYEVPRTHEIMASSHQTLTLSLSLHGDQARSGNPPARPTQKYDFPSSALKAIGPLDPREDIVVEFDFQDGPQYMRFEVGDFIPGLIHVGLASPFTHKLSHSAS